MITPYQQTDGAISSYRMRLEEYYAVNHKLPNSLAELPNKSEPPADASLREKERVKNHIFTTKDGWGKELGYSFDENKIITIWSLGKDGIVGGEGENSDIVDVFKVTLTKSDGKTIVFTVNHRDKNQILYHGEGRDLNKNEVEQLLRKAIEQRLKMDQDRKKEHP